MLWSHGGARHLGHQDPDFIDVKLGRWRLG